MSMGIDFHSHILPGADHGSSSVETSLAQIKLLKSAGINKIVATPHFYPQSHSVSDFLDMRHECAERLAGSLKNESPKIYMGAEVLVCPGLENMDGLLSLCIKGTKTLLLEMPLTSSWSESLYRSVHNISNMDVNIVLAHVDRYPISNVKRLMAETGARGQLNVSSYGNFLNNKRFFDYLNTGNIVAVGSDIHGEDKKCAKSMSCFIKRKDGLAAELFKRTEMYLMGANSIN